LKIKKLNCSPKFDVRVEIPCREQIYDICNDIKPKIIDQVFEVEKLVDLAGNFISRRFRVDTLHAKALEVEQGELNINAFYDPEKDERGKVSIELVIVTNPSDKYIILDEELFNLFIKHLADSLAHELIHMRQARSRDFLNVTHRARQNTDLDESIQYLSDPDEIDAYAYNIATELRDHPNPIQKILNPKTIAIQDSANLWAYIQTFHKNLDNPVLKKLLKKIYKYLS